MQEGDQNMLETEIIPWEGSGWVLECLAVYQQGKLNGVMRVIQEREDINVSEYLDGWDLFTNLWATWCWRVHLAAQDLEPPKVLSIAKLYADVELVSALRKWKILRETSTIDLQGLDDFLAFRPYQDTHSLLMYKEAVEFGLAKPLPAWNSIVEFESSLITVTDLPGIAEQHGLVLLC